MGGLWDDEWFPLKLGSKEVAQFTKLNLDLEALNEKFMSNQGFEITKINPNYCVVTPIMWALLSKGTFEKE